MPYIQVIRGRKLVQVCGDAERVSWVGRGGSRDVVEVLKAFWEDLLATEIRWRRPLGLGQRCFRGLHDLDRMLARDKRAKESTRMESEIHVSNHQKVTAHWVVG